MIAIDALLVPAALFFALSLQHSTLDAWTTTQSYLPLLPYILIIAATLTIWLGVSSTMIKDYEAGLFGPTALFAVLLTLTSTLLTSAANMALSPGTQIAFGTSFFLFSVIIRAVQTQLGAAMNTRLQADPQTRENAQASINPRSFLGRDEVAEQRTQNDEGAKAYAQRTVLITGAGGSIGSELSRQLLECKPTKIVLYELSELALYQIHQQLLQLTTGKDIDIVPLLGSVMDGPQVRRVLQQHKVEVVLHAAAYKHVPLVEHNPLAGLANNVLGTHTLVSAAAETGVERFVLISSDKAVRPTNVMGASKRLAELVVQDFAERVAAKKGIIFSIVRFGNVLGSSGSVVPLFQEQLRRGGPLTLTHRDVSRYFMTVEEAVHLVLRAGSMAKGGEVFVLDMGEPVRIEALARQVITSAGLTVRDDQNPGGDIDIAITGLRPGEKLTEELTLTGELLNTGHGKIFHTVEGNLSEIEVASALRSLRNALADSDEEAALAMAHRWVEGYRDAKTVNPTDRTKITPAS